jgi:hypothetical protein
MPILLDSATSSSLTHPSSENLLMLIVITGGLLFICLVLLVIVVLRSKARKKKAALAAPVVVKEEVPQKSTPAEVKPVISVTKPEPKKEVVEVVIKKEEIKPVAEVKPVIENKTPPPVQEIPVKKTEETLTPADHIAPTEIKKPDEVIIRMEENKPEVKPLATTVEEKKKEFNKALEETHSKEDNLRILQERLAELSKEKKTTVTVVETNESTPGVEPPIETEKTKPVEHEKLVDLTAMIVEKLQPKTETVVSAVEEPNKEEAEINHPVLEEVKEEVTEPAATETTIPVLEETITPAIEDEIKEEPIASTEEPNTQEKLITGEEETATQDILTPFLDNIKSNLDTPAEETPEAVIHRIDEEIKSIAEQENPEVVEEPEVVSPAEEQESATQLETTAPPKDQAPKTFTEWLNTLKK